MSEELTDTSPMPFGKHQGELMQDVPARYLHWLWTEGVEHEKSSPIHKYIKNSLDALKHDYPDGIW